MISSNSKTSLKSKPIGDESKKKSPGKEKNIPMDGLRIAMEMKDLHIKIIEDKNEHLNKFRTELEGKINSAKQEAKEEIKTLKSDAIKVAGLICTVLIAVLGLVAWLIVPDINNIKSIPVHKEKIEQLEKNFDKLITSKKLTTLEVNQTLKKK